jgi:hypothetical protein
VLTVVGNPEMGEAEAEGTGGPHYLTEEFGESGIVWDLGTYEIVKGSLSSGELVVFLSGRKLEGEWSLRRVKATRWCVVNRSAGIKRGLHADASALEGNLTGKKVKSASLE